MRPPFHLTVIGSSVNRTSDEGPCNNYTLFKWCFGPTKVNRILLSNLLMKQTYMYFFFGGEKSCA